MGEEGLPKSLLPLGNTTAFERLIQCLRESEISRIVVVTGFRAEAFQRLPEEIVGGVKWVHNPDFSSTGSLQSLACGIPLSPGPALVVESDLIFEKRALPALLAAREEDAILASGETGHGDEIICREDAEGWLHRLERGGARAGASLKEFVGLSRFSPTSLRQLEALAKRLETGSNQTHYESGINELAAEKKIVLVFQEDLCWTEFDTPAMLKHAREVIYPKILRADQSSHA